MPESLHPTLAAFDRTSWVVVGGYFALMIFVGLYVGHRRRHQDAEQYFLGERSLPSWALAVSIVATTLSAATFVGVPDEVYLGDISYLILNIGGILAVFIVALLFVPTLYRAGTVTIYGYLGKRFGEPAMMAVSCTFLVGRMLASGTRLFFAAIPLCLLLFDAVRPTYGEFAAAICLIGIVGTFYTITGGIRAVVWTDTIQLALVIGAALLTIGVLLNRIPLSIPEILNVLGDEGTGVAGGSKLRLVDTSLDFAKPYTIWAALFAVVFLNTATYGVDHDFAQRFLVSKSVARGAASVIAAQFIGMLTVSLFMVIGLLLWIFYRQPGLMGAAAPGYEPTGGIEPVYPQFLLRELPPLASGFALAGFFAIAQGSMDSAINAMASSAVADLYLPLRRRFGRPADPARATAAPKIAVAAMGCVMTLFALGCAFVYDPRQTTLLRFALGILTFAFAGMLGVFLTALLTRRGNNVSVIAALLAGAATITLLQPAILGWWTAPLLGAPLRLAWPWWMPIGTAVAFLVCVAGRPPAERLAARGFEVAAAPEPSPGRELGAVR